MGRHFPAALKSPAIQGWIIPIIILAAFTYVVWCGKYVSGMLTFPGLSLEITLYRSFYSDDGMLGMIATISATFVVMFIIFGAFLAAHMIIFWLSQDSSVKPPVCLTAFAAATIAKSPPMATGFTAWRLAKGLYIVPLLFAYTPFLNADLWPDFQIAFFAAFGIYALAAALELWMETRLPISIAILLAGTGVALLWPTSMWINFAGLAVFGAIFAHNIWRDRRARRVAA